MIDDLSNEEKLLWEFMVSLRLKFQKDNTKQNICVHNHTIRTRTRIYSLINCDKLALFSVYIASATTIYRWCENYLSQVRRGAKAGEKKRNPTIDFMQYSSPWH